MNIDQKEFKMKPKKFTDLTVDEVKQIVTDIFNPVRISCIKYNKRDDEISCKIYTKWGTEDDEFGIEIISDELTLRNPFDYGNYAIVVDFPTNENDFRKLKQFCVAKGIYGVAIDFMFDNPYMTDK